MAERKLAIIRIRGSIKKGKKILDSLNLLRLYRQNTCVVVPNTPPYIGMISKVKDFITWGEIDEDTFKLLISRRGKIVGNKPLKEDYLKEKTKMDFKTFSSEFMGFNKQLKDIPGLKPFFRLRPPENGFDRKGIKKQFSIGGALGYRKDKINDLIRRML